MYDSTGIYTLSEAQRLIQVPARTIRRWLYGYNFPKVSGQGKNAEQAFSVPLWHPQLSKDEYDGAEVIGFNDLLELRFVAAFVNYGVPLPVVRRCLENAREIWGLKYPMSSGHFKTDGKTIFAEAVKESLKQGALVDLKSRQFVFKEIISPSLYAGIAYEANKASKWYPKGQRQHIVLDPKRQFGSPIIEETGTPTDVLYASYLAEGQTPAAVALTAKIYQTSAASVKSAIAFEQGLRQSFAQAVH